MMNTRLSALIGALIALYILIIVFFAPNVPTQAPASRPTTADSGRVGLLGLQRWLQQGGIPTKSLRLRYGSLTQDPELPRQGNLLIMVLPQSHPAREQEREQLGQWLTQGNHLLVLTASSDRPRWSWFINRTSQEQILADLGFELEIQKCDCEEEEQGEDAVEDEKKAQSFSEAMQQSSKAFEPQQHQLQVTGAHPILSGVRTIELHSVLATKSSHSLTGDSTPRASLIYLKEPEDGAAAFWEIRHHDSRVWISRYADLFGNVSLGKGDNARLLVNIVSASLRHGGMVIFDDMHHGLSQIYDPDAFFSDPRLHNSLWFLFAMWLVYVVGHNNRLAPLRTSPQVPKAADFVRATGGLFARRLTPVASARILFSHFFDTLRLQYSMPTNGKPVWELIEISPRSNAADVKALRQWYDKLEQRPKHDLIKLVNLMHKIRRTLL